MSSGDDGEQHEEELEEEKINLMISVLYDFNKYLAKCDDEDWLAQKPDALVFDFTHTLEAICDDTDYCHALDSFMCEYEDILCNNEKMQVWLDAQRTPSFGRLKKFIEKLHNHHAKEQCKEADKQGRAIIPDQPPLPNIVVMSTEETETEPPKIATPPADKIEIIYVVHSGMIQENGSARLTRPVCSRLTLEDAQSVADELNAAQEGGMLMAWCASICFPLMTGNGEQLQEALADPAVLAEWEAYFAPLRRPIYTVKTLKIDDSAEQAKLAEELRVEKEALESSANE